MVARSNPPLRDISSETRPEGQELDPDSPGSPTEPMRPSEAERRQMLALVPSPGRLAMIGGCIASAFVGGAIGYWLGKRRAQRPARPIRHVAATVDSVMDLAPVAMHLLANPLVRGLALRVLLRQISRRIDH
jgi:hypothetical protein